jgi:autotransporter-associated beta strand protein
MFFDWIRSSDRTVAPRTRTNVRRRQAKQVRARRRLEVQLLEERRVMATWVGGPSGDWNVAANWSTPANVPDGDVPGESALFNTAAAVSFDISTAFANPIAVQFDPGSAATITPAAGATSLRVSSLANTAGINSIAAVISGASINANVSGGVLTISGNNTYGGTVTAQAGVLALVASPTSNPLGTAELVLNGGTAEVSSSAAPVQGRFVQVINNGTVARSLQISEIEVFSPNFIPGLYSTAPAGNATV